jgi:hypothetical protein
MSMAGPFYYAGTGHYYEAFTGNLTWQEAKTEAEGRSYNGASGRLTTITSAEENAFVSGTVLPSVSEFKFWIGGFQPDGSAEPNGGWEWVTGESFAYTNWYLDQYPPEPSNQGGNENCLEIMGKTSDGGTAYLGFWNDKYGLSISESNGSVVEYVPEPGTICVLSIGALALARRRVKSGRQ